MNTTSDWQSVNRELLARQRQKLGEPPTLEEMQAYLRGELSPQDEERVRELLVCYPDLARALVEPFPAEDAKPGEPGSVSDVEMEQRWKALHARVQPRDGGVHVLRYSRGLGLIAAILVLCFGAVLWRAQTRDASPRLLAADERSTLPSRLLMPAGQRGPASATTVKANGQPLVLILALVSAPEADATYRVAVYSTDSTTPLWQSNDPAPLGDDDTFRILVPARFLQPGSSYQIKVWRNGQKNELATYSFRAQ